MARLEQVLDFARSPEEQPIALDRRLKLLLGASGLAMFAVITFQNQAFWGWRSIVIGNPTIGHIGLFVLANSGAITALAAVILGVSAGTLIIGTRLPVRYHGALAGVGWAGVGTVGVCVMPIVGAIVLFVLWILAALLVLGLLGALIRRGD